MFDPITYPRDIHHWLFITGVARSGTTFMLAYFHRLGFNTGFPDSRIDLIMAPPKTYSRVSKYASHGGLEYLGWCHKQRKKFDRSVEVIKDPWGEKTAELIKKRGITFDNGLLMVRDSEASAKSQRVMVEKKGKHRPGTVKISVKRNDAHKADARQWLAANTSRVIEVEFPRCIEDFEYLWVQVKPFIGRRVTKQEANKAWQQLRNRKYVRH